MRVLSGTIFMSLGLEDSQLGIKISVIGDIDSLPIEAIDLNVVKVNCTLT